MTMDAEEIRRRAREGNWNRIVPFSGDKELIVEGIGPCLGVIIYNRNSGDGVWGHFTQPVFYDEDELAEIREIDNEFAILNDLLDFAAQENLMTGDFVVAAAGMSPNPVEPGLKGNKALQNIDEVSSTRKKVTDLLHDLVPQDKLVLELIDELCIACRMIYNPRQEKITVERIRLYHQDFTPEYFFSQWLQSRKQRE